MLLAGALVSTAVAQQPVGSPTARKILPARFADVGDQFLQIDESTTAALNK